MVSRKWVNGFAAVAALCASAGWAGAQEAKLVVMWGGSSVLQKVSFTQAGSHYSTAFATSGKVTLGIEVPLKKSNIFAFEGTFGIGPDNLKLNRLSLNPVVETAYSSRDYRASGDLVARLPHSVGGARPYFVVGAEFDRFSPTAHGVSTGAAQGFGAAAVATLVPQNSPGGNFGGGLEWKVTRSLGLRIDVRDHITNSVNLGLPAAMTATSGAYYPVSGIANTLEYSIGLLFSNAR